MNIIIATGAKPPYIAAIFEQWQEAYSYMAKKPTYIVGTSHVNSIGTYPFYIVEINNEFYPFQNLLCAKSFCCEELKECILYTILADYTPSELWNNEMGRLQHVHLNCDDSEW